MTSAYNEALVDAAVKLRRGQLLDLLLEIEDGLKLLVRAVFAQKRRDWEQLIPERIRRDLEERRAKEAAGARPVATPRVGCGVR